MPTKPLHQPDTTRSIFYALGANVAIAAAKFAGAAYTGSGALEGLLLLGRKQAKARPSAHHPLGQGRATYFWSFVVALLLFSLGGLLSIYEGVRKLDEVAPIDMPWVAATIVLVTMAAEGLSLRTALQQVGKVRGDRSLRRWFRETRRSELIVVLSEDLAAIAGLFLALAALLATIATGNTVYDAMGSIAVGVVLIVVASGSRRGEEHAYWRERIAADAACDPGFPEGTARCPRNLGPRHDAARRRFDCRNKGTHESLDGSRPVACDCRLQGGTRCRVSGGNLDFLRAGRCGS